jgi:hypothetical protein
MRSARLAFVVALMGCSGSVERSNPRPPEIGEVEFISDFLGKAFESRFASDSVVLLYGTFVWGPWIPESRLWARDSAQLLRRASDSLPIELIQDFLAKNAGIQEIWPELTSRLPLVAVTQRELDSIFVLVGYEPKSRDSLFHARFPKAKTGLISISRVGFNRDRDLALWYYGTPIGGGLYMFRKSGSEWKKQSAVDTWIE